MRIVLIGNSTGTRRSIPTLCWGSAPGRVRGPALGLARRGPHHNPLY